MPFLNRALFEYMLGLRDGQDAVVPLPGAYPEPTHALYAKACLPHIEVKLQANDLKISGFFDQVRVRYVGEAEIGAFDPEFLSFFNVNSPEDLARAREVGGRGEGSIVERAMTEATNATNAINVKVELFGTPRVKSGHREVSLSLPGARPAAGFDSGTGLVLPRPWSAPCCVLTSPTWQMATFSTATGWPFWVTATSPYPTGIACC